LNRRKIENREAGVLDQIRRRNRRQFLGRFGVRFGVPARQPGRSLDVLGKRRVSAVVAPLMKNISLVAIWQASCQALIDFSSGL